MGVYEQGTSNGQTEPVIGHPVYPPPVAFTQPLPAQMQMPPVRAVVPEGCTGQWNASLCGCCSDCDMCCQTCWCPCVTFGQVAEVVDEGQVSCCVQATIYGLLCSVGIPCVYSFMWRQKLRQKFKLERGCCGDFCVHCCCAWCALCQEHRELRSRGLDPSLGWEVAQQTYFRPMAVPTPPGAMLR
ncbi:hypothetical protein M758_2G161400 [Ceratodon purpureus]|nr:hypothetical protein M758_2G161400 [Ceratodon purpureus]